MPRPRLKTEVSNPFHALLLEAVEAVREARDWDSPADRTQHKATAAEMLRVALKVARRDEKWAREQHRAILDGGADTETLRGHLWRFGRDYISGPNWSGAIPHPNRLGFNLTDAARTEASRLRLTVGDLYALAVLETARRWPDSFGPVEDLAEHRRRGEALRERAAELCRRVSTEWTQGDLQIGDVDKAGRSHITFRVSGGSVPAAPQDTAGERLTNWLLSNPPVLKELQKESES